MDAASAEFLRLYQEECRRQQEALNAAEVSLLSVRPCLGCTGRCAGAAAPACTRVRVCPRLRARGEVLGVLRWEGLSVEASVSTPHTCTHKFTTH